MEALILVLFLLIMILLGLEAYQVKRDRALLQHVVYVNGIRGKSTVTRMIAAGLKSGGWSVFCKTTGTVPRLIGTDGVERPLRRRGKANIREQARVMRMAVREHAQVLVIECMAVDPFLQEISQRKIVRSDIGVITNVRLDHTEEMGLTLEEICDSLSRTIPEHGILYTADTQFWGQMVRNAEKVGARVELSRPADDLPNFDFPENVALALAVCGELGVDREAALAGILSYQPDPYALSAFRLPQGALFINAMAVNDPKSTCMNYRRMAERLKLDGHKLILLINNRADRGYRAIHMAMVAHELQPEEVWITGGARGAVCREIKKRLPGTPVYSLGSEKEVPLDRTGSDTVIFAAGNLAGPGRSLIERGGGGEENCTMKLF